MEETTVMPEAVNESSTTTASSIFPTTTTIISTTEDNDYFNFILGGENEGSSEGSADDYYGNWLSDGDEEYNYEYPVGSGNSEPLPILFNEGIDLNVFNVTKLNFEPQAWDAQQAFTSKVLGRLYLVIPGVIVGLVLGLALWAVLTLVARSLSAVKKKVIPREDSSEESGSTSSRDDNSMEMAAVEERDLDCPDGIYPAPPSPNLHFDKKDIERMTAADIESGTTSSGIGKSESSIPKSDSSSCIVSSQNSSNGSIS